LVRGPIALVSTEPRAVHLDPSVGSVGDALDHARADTTVGSLKNEADPTPRSLARRRPRRDRHCWLGRLVQHRASHARARRLRPGGRGEAPLRSPECPAGSGL